jgi:ribulose-phosphate 3-epimerase
MIQIAPSLLAADFARLGEALKFLKDAGAEMVHLDVMDGHFVPELTVGQPVVKSLRRSTDLILDLHLCVNGPERYLDDFIKLGAERIAIHFESTPNPHHGLSLIRNAGRKAGLALNTSTAVESAKDVLGEIDYLLILSADLGFPEPRFLQGALAKVRTARDLRRKMKRNFAIQVEGCIGREHIASLTAAGADILVAGSDIFEKDAGARWLDLMRRYSPPGRTSRVS